MILHYFRSIGTALNYLTDNNEISCLVRVAGRKMYWDGFSLAEMEQRT